MIGFQLFRIKVYPDKQLNLFQDKGPSEILKEAILSLPSAEFRKGITWHLGNITKVDEDGFYFRIGKTTTATIEVYRDGNFTDQQFEAAPYTHIILDSKLEICAIAKKVKLSPNVGGIARQLVRLLNESKVGVDLKATFEIDALSDPENFISYIKKAYNISRFWITFSRPNPFDVNEDFGKPFGKFLRESDADKGKAEIKGDNLNSVILEELARSAAATGDDAGALIKTDDKCGNIRKQLRGNPVIIEQEDLTDSEQKKSFLNIIRQIYRKIRGKSKDNE